MIYDLAGKTALITGAARRIGYSTAQALAEKGTNIVIHYRTSEEEANHLCSEVEKKGVRAWPVKGDFEKPEEYETLIQRSAEIAGPLDILVNSASIFMPSTLREVAFQELMRNMQVNAWAPFLFSRQFAQQGREGRIINLLDTRLHGYDWAHVAYILSKQVLGSLTRMLALELAPNISVNAVAPGLILPPPGKDHEYLHRLTETVPLKRHGGPEDIVEAVLYLLRSNFVTGQVIHVDGGRNLMEYTHGPHPD